ncbi:Oidioi.mRNA.OKI2018_I69.XSR.g14848.t1.cds [Oikopleura dioica]|uniref:Oidioi.mRNA.OKI2018_I69.XSR.g14848.t1.cds n=1 Tax=Oikopleura dioica TaxID=34765 RepID=A0ABN7SG17_OIKDI|nr:Oidioi.mRNA.OKI2018_I69.XSR.g14848.t1.cds [Oikopleura dioica]
MMRMMDDPRSIEHEVRKFIDSGALEEYFKNGKITLQYLLHSVQLDMPDECDWETFQEEFFRQYSQKIIICRALSNSNDDDSNQEASPQTSGFRSDFSVSRTVSPVRKLHGGHDNNNVIDANRESSRRRRTQAIRRGEQALLEERLNRLTINVGHQVVRPPPEPQSEYPRILRVDEYESLYQKLFDSNLRIDCERHGDSWATINELGSEEGEVWNTRTQATTLLYSPFNEERVGHGVQIKYLAEKSVLTGLYLFKPKSIQYLDSNEINALRKGYGRLLERLSSAEEVAKIKETPYDYRYFCWLCGADDIDEVVEVLVKPTRQERSSRRSSRQFEST